MLQSATPSCSLRNGDFRTVFDGIWTEQLQADAKPYASILAYMRSRPAETHAGVLNTLTRRGSTERDALKAVCEDVADKLCAMELLEPLQRESVFAAAVLMSTRGAQPHFDGQSNAWRNRLFWALCLEDTDTDVLFGNLKIRIPLSRGTFLVFDGNQPHCVLAREHDVFMKSHFKKHRSQFFVGGDFTPKDWAALGVRHVLTAEDLVSRVDVQTMLVDQKMCTVKPGRSRAL